MTITNEIEKLKQREALAWHLAYNFIPAPPPELIDYCIEAIDACNEGDPIRAISLPGGVSVTAGQLVDDLRLNDLVEGQQ